MGQELYEEENAATVNTLGGGVPSYMLAADTHNVANGNDSWLDAATLGTAAVVGAAATQLYNIAPTIGNWFGGEFEEAKTKDVLTDFDSDIGNYYGRHTEGVDALGFMLSSIAPGLGGVKVLKAGQVMLRGAAEAGTLGTNMGAAFGLLPSQPKLLVQAIEAALKSNAGFPVWNPQTIKAITAGFGQAALEGAAWETAVAATMSNSPVLQKQDLGDITSNILWGAATFGAIGGVLHGAGIYSKIKGAAAVTDREMMPVTLVRELPQASKSDQILNYFEDAHYTKNVTPDATTWTGDQAWKLTKYDSLKAEKLRYIDDKVRTLTGELAGGDQEIAEHLYTNFKLMPLEEIEAKLYGTVESARLGTVTKTEVKLNSIAGKAASLSLEEGSEELKFLQNREVSYLKLTGEGAGKTTLEKPALWNLADELRPGATITVDGSRVVAGARNYRFGTDITAGKSWDILAADHFETEARQIWASKLPAFVDGQRIVESDIPLLDKAYRDGILPVIKLEAENVTGKDALFTFQSKEEFFDFLVQKKQEVAEALAAKVGEKGEKLSLPEVAKMANVSQDYVSGLQKGSLEDNLFAREKAIRDYQAKFEAAGQRPSGEFYDQPSWAKSVKDTTPVLGVDGNVVDGLVAIKQKQVLFEQAADRATAPIYGDYAESFFRLSDSAILKANRNSVGGGMVSAQNENYGTLGSAVQQLGALTLKLIGKTQEATRESLNAPLYKLAQNQAAAIEWSVLHSKIRSYGSVAYGYDAEAGAMRPLAVMNYEKAVAEGKNAMPPVLPDSVPLEIPIKHQETIDAIEQHIRLNGDRVDKLGNIRANQGVNWNRDPERFYPIPPNIKDYPFIASVIDESIAGHGHGKMLYAATDQDLEAQITAVRTADPTLKVLTKNDAETWYKSVGQYEFERTLTDLSFDMSKASRGVSAGYLPATDPAKIVADTLNWHLSRDSALVREAVAHQNEAQFATLRTMGEKFANVKDSHYTNLAPISYLEMQGKNPYADYCKSALGLHTAKDFPFWTPLNDMLDRKVSEVFNRVYEAFGNAKNVGDLEVINKQLADAGYQGAAYTAMTQATANHSAPKGALTAFIGKANAILSSCMIGLDPINAITNLVGSTVLRNTELQSLIRNINKGDATAAGELAGLSKLRVPGVEGAEVFSPAKMIANALGDFHSDAGKALRETFKSRGIISSRVDQANWVLDNLALTGKESVSDLDSKLGTVFGAIKKAAATGEKLTGNTLAEELNRFVSGHVAKQITDKAVAAGLLGEKEAWAYVNTFVNRVEGNYLAAQRPGIFQGPIGQAIGLFQTYQFNLIQQLLRHVGEGGAKDAAMMMGLQSTIFGLKGLPAFDAINTNIIGNASGNTQHRDLYDAVFGAAGKDAGEWLMYGLGSNALGLISPDLKMNLYSRGDINPRNVTLLPTNPANIPFVQASTKFLSNVYETATKIAQGGSVWNSMLQGIEHAGVSRPLAGLAQTLEALGNPQGRSYSTSTKGNIVASNDFLSLANFIRIAGAKPLDEAIATDRMFNLEVYAAKDTSRRQTLGESIKTTMMAGQKPTEQQVDNFAYLYAKAGGKQEKFNQFMVQQYKAANTSQVNALADNLKKPFAQSMQLMMGGDKLRDFANSPE